MKKLITLLALCCLMVTGAWAQTVVATMQQLVDAASTKTATVSPFYTTSVTGGAVYSFTGNGGNSGTYIGGITNDAVDAAFTGSKIVTVAAWVYGRPNGCIFGYGDEQTGVKFMLSTSGTNTTFKTTTKGKLDFTPVNFTLQEDAWNLVAFSVYGKASSTSSYRYYYGTTNGNYSTKTDKTMSTMNAASKFAIGSGNQGSAREVFSSDIANLTVITSDGYLNNSNIASIVGAAPTAVSHNYETYADGEFTYGPLNGNTWSAWSGSIPAELSALGSTYNATNLKVIEKYYTFAESGELSATFNYTDGQNRLDIAGLQVFSSTGVQIGADFHVGKAGNPSANNGYSVFIPEGGSYIVRYISTANCGSEQNIDTNGKVENAFVSGDFPVQDGKTYYIYNANNNDVKTYLYPSGTGLGLSTTCYEEPAYMWTCVKNGAYYNFRNVATGKWLGFKEVSNGAYNFKLKIVDFSKEYVTLYSVDQSKYMLVNNDGSKFDQSTKADNSGWSSKYGFTECSVSDLYFSESLASDKVKWLRAANCSNTGYVMTVKDGDTAGSNLHTAGTDAAAEGQLFAFVGNQENGFVIYNKKLGNTYTLTAADTNEGTAATWVLNAETPTKWYLDESQLNASSQPGYGITTSSTSGGRSLNMWAGNGGDAKFYANGAGNGGSRWQFSLVDSEPTVIHYVVSGTKAHNDANNYVGVLKITKGTFASNTYVGTDVNGKTFNAYLPKTQESISISNTKLHGWDCNITENSGEYTVTYTAEATDYQYLAFDESAQWYRIPAIAKASNGDLVAVYDYRVCHNDVGFGEVDQVMRRSTDGGVTWSEETKIADGNGGGNHFGAAYGDPALVADRESNNMTLITVSGQQSYPGATATSRPMVAALFSSDNGQHWSDPVDITSQFWGSKGAMFQDEDTEAASTTFAYSGFFGSGKILQSRITKVGSYYRLYAAMLCRGKNVSGAYVVYSDDMGRNWSLLGGDNSKKACSGSDEPKVEELPDGSIVLSGRKSYGRYFNIWTWTTKPTADNKAGEGFWGTDVQSNQQTNGISVGSNSCNGEILLVDVKNSTTGQPAKLMLQSLPSGNSRDNVEIWYKDVTDDSAYSTVSTFASNWTKGLRVSNTSSAYSTMTEQADGRIGFFYEEGPATYCMVYVPLTIEKITNNAYEKVVEDIPTPALSLETESTVTSSQLSELSITFTGDNAAQVQLSATQHTAYLTPKASTPAQVKAQNGKFKAAGETPAAIEGTITKDTNTDGKFNIAFEDEIPAGDYELSIPEGTFLVGTTPIPVLKANYTVEEPVLEGFHIYESNGTYSNTASDSSYKDKWLSTDTNPQFTILVTGGGRAVNNMSHNDTYADSGIVCNTGNNSIGYKSTMTVSVQSGYKITGYTFKVKNLDGNNTKVVTTADKAINTTADNQTVVVSNVNADSFTITIDGSTGSYNEGVVFTDFYVTYEGEPVVELSYTITPATINTVQPADLTTVKIMFPTDDFPELSEEEMHEYVPTLSKEGEENINATGITLNEDTGEYEITFPTTGMADGTWTLTIPQGTFITIPATESEVLPDPVPVAEISVAYKVQSIEALTIQDHHLYTIKGAFADDVLLPLVRNGNSMKGGAESATPQTFVFLSTTHENKAGLAPLYKLGTVEGNGYFTYGGGVGSDAVPMAFLTSSTQLQGDVTWDGTAFKEGYFGMVGVDNTKNNDYRTYVVQANTNVNYNGRYNNDKISGSNQLQGTNTWSFNYILEEITGYTVYDVVVEANGANVSYTGTAGNCLTTTAQGNGGYLVVKSDVDLKPSNLSVSGITSGLSAVINISGTTITISATASHAVPATGYYYIKDLDSGKYLYNDLQNSDYTQSGTKVAFDNGYVWHIESQAGVNTITLHNGEGTGYKASAGAEELDHVDVSEKNWEFEAYTGHIVPVEVEYAIFGAYVPFYEAWMTYPGNNNAAHHGGFFTFQNGSNLPSRDDFGYSQNVIGQLSPDGTNWIGAELENPANWSNGIANAYYYSQQDEDRIAEVFDRSYDIFYKHVGKPGYCSEVNQDMIDNDETLTFFAYALEYFYPSYLNGELSLYDLLAYSNVYPYNFKYILGSLNDYVQTLDIVQPAPGEAFHIAVRGNDYTGKTKYYLKNDGSVTANEEEADVFVMGSTDDTDCNALFVSNNNKVDGVDNSGPHYLQNHSNAAYSMSGTYSEENNALKLETMMAAEGKDITNACLYRYGAFSVTGTDGKVITFDEANKTWSTSADHAYMNDIATSAIELIPVEYPYNKPKFAVGSPDDHDGGYASIWLPFPMVFPEGVEAYRATSVENDGILILTKVNEDTNTVAAGGYILYTPGQGEDTDPDNLPLVLPAPADPEDVTPYADNAFVGSTENPLVVKEEGSWATFKAKYEGTPYVLARKNKVIGYYKYRDTETYLPKGKAIWFSNYKADSSAECLRFTFEEVISAIEALHGNTDNAEIYDLQGHRLNKVEKGQVNVINGKKVMFK